jgi:hypothetical protein
MVRRWWSLERDRGKGALQIYADQTGAEEIRARLNTRFTPDAGFNGKGGLGPLFGWRLTGTFRANRI